MPTKLPGPDELGPTPQWDTGGRIAQIDTTAIGRGLASAGANIEQAGGNLLDVGMRQQRETDAKAKQAQAYNVAASFQDFETARREAAVQQSVNMQPGGAGLVEGFTKDYRDNAQKFWASVPPELQPEYKEKIHALQGSLGQTMVGIARKEGISLTDYNEQTRANQNIIQAGSNQQMAVQGRDAAIQRNSLRTDLDPEEKRKRDLNIREMYQKGFVDNAARDPNVVKEIYSGDRSRYLNITQARESGGNPDAKNPNSTATGTFQFTGGTWNEMMRKHPDLGLTADGRTDPVQSRKAAAALADDNAKVLGSAGVQPTDQNLYMAHFLGAGGGKDPGAVEFLKAMQQDPNQPAANVVPKAAGSNHAVFYDRRTGGALSLAQVYHNMTHAYGPDQADPGGPPDQYGIARNYWAKQPIMEGATPEMVDAAARGTMEEYRRQQTESRAALQQEELDRPAALANSGTYTGQKSTAQDWVDAYGPQEGPTRYQMFQNKVEAAQTAFNMRTMTPDEINKVVEGSQPTSTGYGAGVQSERAALLKTAAAAALEGRKQPADYVTQTNPNLAQRWQSAIQSNDPTAIGQAITMSQEAQKSIGIKPQDILPLPSNVAGGIMDTVKKDPDPTHGLALVSSMVRAAGDNGPAVVKQLVAAGLPAGSVPALNALQDGRPESARRLYVAATTDPKEVWGKDAASKDVQQDMKTIGGGLETAMAPYLTPMYGINQAGTGAGSHYVGDPQDMERLSRDQDLLVKAVKINMRNGEDAASATKRAVSDLFGNTQIMNQRVGNVRSNIAIPATMQPDEIAAGLARLEPKIQDQLMALAPNNPISKLNMRSYGQNQIIPNAEWRNQGSGVALYDKASGQFLPNTLHSLTEVQELARVGRATDIMLPPPGVRTNATGVTRSLGIPSAIAPETAPVAPSAPPAPPAPVPVPPGQGLPSDGEGFGFGGGS